MLLKQAGEEFQGAGMSFLRMYGPCNHDLKGMQLFMPSASVTEPFHLNRSQEMFNLVMVEQMQLKQGVTPIISTDSIKIC